MKLCEWGAMKTIKLKLQHLSLGFGTKIALSILVYMKLCEIHCYALKHKN